MQRIYMDANATTPVLAAVVDAMLPFWAADFGNASAVHAHGRGARGAIDTAREHVAHLLSAKPAEITFTSGGTESDNLALFGILHPGDHLITSAIEHDAVLHAADALQANGIAVTCVGCNADGVVSAAAVAAAMRPQTRLVSIMLANNETGVLQPLSAIALAAHAGGALLHTDAVQACGKIPVDVHALGCDLLSLSAHKMHGPQGVGALWARPGITVRPMLFGGGQERRRRAGTENVAGIAGMGTAAALTVQWLASGSQAHLALLRDTFVAGLRTRIDGITVNGEAAARLPNTASLQFAGVDAEALVIALDLRGLAISGGSACQSGVIEPSHVLVAMALSAAAARSSVRFSLSRTTTPDEVAAAIDIVTAAVDRLRSIR